MGREEEVQQRLSGGEVTQEALIAIAKYHEDANQSDRAIEFYKQIAEVSEENRAAAWEYIGDLYRDKLKDVDEALRAYDHSLEVEPERVSSLVGKAQAYEAFEHWEQANEIHQQIAEKSEEHRKSAEGYQLVNLLRMGREEEVQQRLSGGEVTQEALIAIAKYHEDANQSDRAIG